jgi:hypothetical protein
LHPATDFSPLFLLSLSVKGIILPIVFVLGSKMCHLNKKEEEGHINSSDGIRTGNNNGHATAGPTTTIIGINRPADAFVIPGAGVEQTKAPVAVYIDIIFTLLGGPTTQKMAMKK